MRLKSLSPLLRNLAYVFYLAFVVIAASEVIVRYFFPSPAVAQLHCRGSAVAGEESWFKISKNPVLLYEYKTPQFTNRTFKKPGVLRIIVLGDSTTNSLGPAQDYYPKILEDKLNSGLPVAKYEVINAGVIGYNTIQEAEYLEKRLLGYRPDIVIVGYCAFNDRAIKRKLVHYKKYGLYCSDIIEVYPYLIVLPFHEHLMAKSALYRLVNVSAANLAKKYKIGFLTKRIKYFDLTFETQDAIKKIKQISLNNHFRLIFGIIPPIDGSKPHESEWAIGKCRDHAIEFIDFRGVFGRYDYRMLVADSPWDVCHFNKTGHELIAAEIYDYLRGSKSNYAGAEP